MSRPAGGRKPPPNDKGAEGRVRFDRRIPVAAEQTVKIKDSTDLLWKKTNEIRVPGARKATETHINATTESRDLCETTT